MKHFKLYKMKYLFLLLAIIFYSTLDLTKFLILGNMVDMFYNLSIYKERVYLGIIIISSISILVYLIDVFLPYFKNIIVEEDINKIRLEIGNKIINIPFKNLEKMQFGEILTKAMSDIDRVQRFIELDLSNFLMLLFKGVIAGVICLLINWKFLIAFILTIPIIIILSIISGKFEEKLLASQKEETSNLNSFLMDIINNLVVVKSFNLSNKFLRIFQDKSRSVKRIEYNIYQRRALFSFINAISLLLPTIIMMIVGVLLVSKGELTTGEFTIMLAMSSRIANLLGGTQDFIYNYQGYKTSYNRLLELINVPEEENRSAILGQMTDHCMIFKNVSFCYNNNKALDNINMEVKKGEHIALVGRSGCGKSTLIKLISSLYYDYDGQITINGISSIPGNQRFVRDQITLVLQGNYLFPISIRDNITLFSEKYTEKDIIEASKVAGIYDFILSLPEGFDTIVENGGINFSGGQRQRLCIARAYLKKSQLVLLDEFTSALDVNMEKQILDSIEDWLHDKTLITVAHRLSTIRNTDRIYYFENGRIVENGTYEELCNLKGAFYHLFKGEIVGR